ncbi:hypothetical protein ABEB36_001788 [Hypothenemus hampei]|uniref:Cytochrome P450 4aa1 n=1 Tax=Hypothenemus hampei TaxID=57062 RepID=A0ABD1FFS8_HYPHA
MSLMMWLTWITSAIVDYFKSVWLALALPGPAALPLLGNVLLIKNIPELIRIGTNMSSLYKPFLRAWMFFVPIIVIYEPEHLKIVLNSTKVSEKNFFYRVMHTFIGDGLITSTGNKWKTNRRIIQPLFHINFLECYIQDFEAVCEQTIGSLNDQEVVQVTRIVNDSILKILHKTVLGENLLPGQETPFRRGELLIIKRVLRPWLLFDWIFKRTELFVKEQQQCGDLHEYVKNILIRRRLCNKRDRQLCLLNALIATSEENPQEFSQEDVINEAVTFMLAGQDSVGAILTFYLYYMAKHQQVQAKVYKEINQIAFHGSITIHQLHKMTYLEQCLKETLRLLPSVPILARHLIKDVTLSNYRIPKGTNVFISPFVTHRLPHVFTDPLKFNPERFSTENSKELHPYAFLPFSLGPRNCIGYKFAYFEMKIFIATFLRHFHVTLKDESEELKLSYRVTLRAKGGLFLKLQSRQRNNC